MNIIIVYIYILLLLAMYLLSTWSITSFNNYLYRTIWKKTDIISDLYKSVNHTRSQLQLVQQWWVLTSQQSVFNNNNATHCLFYFNNKALSVDRNVHLRDLIPSVLVRWILQTCCYPTSRPNISEFQYR